MLKYLFMQQYPHLEEGGHIDIRLNVKPGITGFAQIYGKYDTPFEEKLKMDIAYGKQKYLFFTDIYVILNTIKLFFLPQKRK